MSRVSVAMYTYILTGNNSISRCSEQLNDPFVRKEFGQDHGISQRTIECAVKLIGDHSDELIVRQWKGLDSWYHFENTDVNIDGSATVVNGPRAELGAVGYSRDFRNQSRNQVKFLIAELQKSRISFIIRAYTGNISDLEQCCDALLDIFSMIGENHGQSLMTAGSRTYPRFHCQIW